MTSIENRGRCATTEELRAAVDQVNEVICRCGFQTLSRWPLPDQVAVFALLYITDGIQPPLKSAGHWTSERIVARIHNRARDELVFLL